jgi:hypothetical protein
MYAMPEGESGNGVEERNTLLVDGRAEARDHRIGIRGVWSLCSTFVHTSLILLGFRPPADIKKLVR